MRLIVLRSFSLHLCSNAEFVERELNAVHSEHQKNLQNDYWRTRQIVRSLYRAGHARRSFSTGDRETLKNAGANPQSVD